MRAVGASARLREASGISAAIGILLCLAAAFIPGPVLAYEYGISGYSNSSVATCSTCHFGGTYTYTASFSVNAYIAKNSTGNSITLSATKNSGTSAVSSGLDVSVSSGALVAGSDTQILSGEIAHHSSVYGVDGLGNHDYSKPVNGSGNNSWTFSYTAPNATGTVTLHGCANQTNHNVGTAGTGADSGDNPACTSTSFTLVTTPTAVADSYSVNENASLTTTSGTGVLANDSDPSGFGTLTLVSNVLHGGLSLNSNGSFTYTPNSTYFGADSFTYKICYGGTEVCSNVATASITVDQLAPTAVADFYSVNEDATLAPAIYLFGVLDNDSDPSDLSLTAFLWTGVSHGALSLNSNGTFTYTPTLGYFGTDSFIYFAYDGTLSSNIATVTITVDQIAPTAVADAYSVNENAVLTETAGTGVLANDTEPSTGVTNTAVLNTNVAHGLLSLNSNGSFTYTPTSGYFGPDSFTYHDNDGLSSGIVTVTLTVNQIAPTAVADAYSVNENAVLTETAGTGVLANDTEPSTGVTNTAVLNANVAHGVLSLNSNGSFTYTPTSGYFGSDSFTYHDNDGLTSGIVTVTLTVNQIEPTAVADAYSINENAVLTETAGTGVLANDTEPSTGVTNTAVLNTNVAHGVLSLNSNGSFTYTPTSGYFGSDSFTYHDNDGLTSGVVTVTLTVNQIAPTALADAYSVNENAVLTETAGTGVLSNDTEPSTGVTDNAVLNANVAHGVLSLNADGSFTYTPTSGYFGPDSFTYHDNDGLSSGIVTVTLTVNQIPPTAVADAYSVNENAVLTETAGTGVLVNDSDPSGLSLTAVLKTNVAHGVLSLNADGSFTYTPSLHYFGTDSFSYQANDGSLSSSAVTVTLTVNQGAPAAVAGAYSVNENATLAPSAGTGVLAKDSDPSNLPLTAVLNTTVAHGSLTLNSDGSFTYTPALHYFGADSFTYHASNGTLSSGVVTVTLTVPQGAPAAVADAYSVNENAVLTKTAAAGVLSNDSDPSSLALSAVLVSTTSHGVLLLNSGGSFTYTPTVAYSGFDSFSYQASNGTLSSSTTTVTLTVVEQPPTAVADVYSVNENATLSPGAGTGVLANDSDPSNLALTAVLNATVAHGALTLNADGSFTYTPTLHYHGADSFTYHANDGTLSSGIVTVTLTVTQGAPIAVADSYSTSQNTTLTVHIAAGVLANDSDPSNLALTAEGVSTTSHGTLTLNSNGSFTYVPTAGYHGGDSFTYTASDGTLSSSVTTASIAVGQAPPVAVADAYSVNENAVLVVPAGTGVLANDTDPSGLPLTTITGALPSHGTLTLNSDGSFTYTPTAHYFGGDSFTYQASDGALTSSVATVTLTVNQVAPTAVADAYSVNENAVLTATSGTGVLVNDTDPSNLTLTAVLNATVAHGALTLNSDGSFTYTPTLHYHGADSFTYHANDGTLNSSVATVSLTVTQGAPTAVADSYSVNENAVLTATSGTGVLANDSDPSNLALTAVLNTTVAHGALTLNADGSFTYTPTLHYHGADSFTYHSSNGTLSSSVATVTLTVTQGAPTAVADAYSVNENAILAPGAGTGVLANDTDPSNLALTAVINATVAHGSLTLNADGSFTYTPTLHYHGADSFTYHANDGTLSSGVVTVMLTVTQGAPTATADSYSTSQNTTLTVNAATGVLANDSDPSNLALTAVLSTTVAHGTLTLHSNGSFTYVPTAGYHGGDSFTYTASDGTLSSSVTTASIAVGQAPPVAVADAYSVNENAVLTVPAGSGVLANDTDPNGLPLTAVANALPSHGTLTLNADGSFTYTPALHYHGADSFTYQASDGTLTSSVATVSLTVTQGAPTAVADSYSVNENAVLTATSGTGVLANDSDPSNLALTAVLNTTVAHGSLTLNADGSFTYTPTLHYHGADSFTYHASNGTLSSSVATVTLTVTQGAPTAVADAYSVNENATLAPGAGAGVLANDTDPSNLALTAVINATVAHGSLTLNADGSFTYTPTLHYHGADSFTYHANDGTLSSGVVTVMLTVTQGAPTATADSYSTSQNTTLTVNAATGVLANDSDPSNLALTAVLSTTVAHGTLTLHSNGSFTYVPTAGYHGGDSFTYTASDGTLSSSVTTASIAVGQAPPVAVADAYSVNENAVLTVPAGSGVLANDTDPNGLPLTAVANALPSHGTLTLNADGSFTYTPALHYHGADSFTYQASDGTLTSSVATVSLTVTQGAPTAVADSYSVNENAVLAATSGTGVLANDSDPSNLALTAVLNTTVAHGSLTLNADGSFTYTPTLHYHGADSFTYHASNGTLSSSVATVTLTVTQGAPTAVADAYSVNENAILAPGAGTGVLANDTDPSNLALTAVINATVAHGSLTLNADGSFTYTPTLHYHGADSFTYHASNGTLSSSVATVTLTVTQGAPTAVADAYSVNENAVLTAASGTGVLANDTDPSNLALTAVLNTTVAHGALTLNSNGSFTYTPSLHYHGADSFTYHASNGSLSSGVVTVALTVNQLAPTAVADSYSVNENATLTATAATGVLANDSDPSSAKLTAVLNAGVAHGALTLNPNGSFSYTPTLQHHGSDSFTYHAFDGALSSSVVTVTISVTQGAPTAVADAYSVNENATLTATAATGVLANDTDPSALALTAVLNTGVAHGSLTLNPNGSFSYTPTLHYHGKDSFTYHAFDGALSSSVVTVKIAVDQGAPTAVADSYSVNENAKLTATAATGVLANDSDPSNAKLTAVLIAGASHGTLTLNPNGSFTYTPTVAYSGFDSFTYQASDGALSSASATVTISVVALAPVAAADSYSVNENAVLTVTAASGVLANDTDPSHLTLTAVLVSGPAHGTLTLNSNGSFTYTPTAAYHGSDSFSYKAFDGSLLSNNATVSIAVSQQPPVATGDSYSVNENAVLTVPAGSGVLANDSDPSHAALTAALVTPPTHGTLTLNSNGSFTYTPTAAYRGQDHFTYKANDGTLSSAAATVTITIAQLPPVAVADAYSATENIALTAAAPGVLANDTDPSNLPLTAKKASAPSHGKLVLNSDGSFTYTPTTGYFGADSFTYTAADGSLTSNVATVSLVVVNAPTVKPPKNISIDAAGYLTYVSLGTATATDPVDGSIAVTADHSSGSYRPGHYIVTYSATNNAGITSSATQSVDVIPLVEFGPDQVTGQNRDITVAVVLDGPAAAYPVTISYTVGGTAGAATSNAASGSVSIDSGTEVDIPVTINTLTGSSSEQTVTLTMTSAGNAVLDTHKLTTITVASGDVAPTVTVSAAQNSTRRTQVFASDGTVDVNAAAVDPNASDSLGYDWSASDSALNIKPGSTPAQIAFAPGGLANADGTPHDYVARVTVTDHHGTAVSAQVVISVLPGSALSPNGQSLSSFIDTNGDGLTDAQQGFTDSNNNGIPDYMDLFTDVFAMQTETGSETTARVIEADPRVQLALGATALSQAGFPSTPGAYPVYLESPMLRSGTLPVDGQYTDIGGLFDLRLTNVTPGGHVDIVLPLQSGVPSGAVFRLYTGKTWISFVTDANNAIASVASVNGLCPAPNSAAYKPGLLPFTDCVRLTVQDGGPDDADGLVNGAVSITGSVAAKL